MAWIVFMTEAPESLCRQRSVFLDLLAAFSGVLYGQIIRNIYSLLIANTIQENIRISGSNGNMINHVLLIDDIVTRTVLTTSPFCRPFYRMGARVQRIKEQIIPSIGSRAKIQVIDERMAFVPRFWVFLLEAINIVDRYLHLEKR